MLEIAILAGICPEWWPRPRFPIPPIPWPPEPDPRPDEFGPRPHPWRLINGIVGAVGGAVAWLTIGAELGRDGGMLAPLVIGLLGGTAAMWAVNGVVEAVGRGARRG